MIKRKLNKFQKFKLITKISLLTIICSIVLTFVVSFGVAYFTKVDIYNAAMGITVGDTLFDRLDSDALTTYQTTVLNGTANDQASWGSKENPYVISKAKHLNNLSALQNIGYFYKHYISKNTFTDGVYTSGDSMPYFLVCNSDGTPVTITGGNTPIKPIGNAEFPFIGSVDGAFVNTSKTEVAHGLSADVSTIYGLNVISNENSVDIGLFGHISCLGEPDYENPNASFKGLISEVKNLLLYDVSVKVDSSLWSEWVAVVDHIFSYKGINETNNPVPHETHHIGIVAGHVTYSKVENISVYYSNENISAIDLTHIVNNQSNVNNVSYLANYMSTTGFIGYLDGMNPSYDAATGTISPNTGTGNSGLIFGGGQGGGGVMSGNYTGYVVAQRVLETYQYGVDGKAPAVAIYPNPYDDITNNNDDPIQTPVYIRGLYRKVITETKDDNGNVVSTETTYEPLCQNISDEGETEKYYFRDGVFTFALSQKSTDTIQPTWWKLDANGKPIETFQVGENDSTKWVANSALPPNSILAYVREITNDVELAAAINAGKEVLILNETDNAALQEKLFIMSLYNTLYGDDNDSLEDKYYTSGLSKNFASSSQIQTYINAYKNGLWTIPEMTSSGSFTAPEDAYDMESLLNTDNGLLKAIFLGDATATTTLNAIRNQFAITVEKTDNYSLSESTTGQPVALNGDNQVIEYFIYSRSTYPTEVTEDGNTGTVQTPVTGYFVCDHDEGGWSLFGEDVPESFTYYWQPIGGEAIPITQVGDTAITSTTNLSTFWQNVTDVNGIPESQPINLIATSINNIDIVYTGAVLYRNAPYRTALGGVGEPQWSDYTLCKSATNTSTLIDMESGDAGSDFKMIYGEPLNAWIYDTTGNDPKWYYYNPTTSTTPLTSAPTLTVTTDVTTGSGFPYYTDGTNKGVIINKCPTYIFSRPNSSDNETNYLQLLTLTYNRWWTTQVYYPLWVGSDEDVKNTGAFAFSGILGSTPPTIESSKEATVTFSSTNGASISFLQTTDNQVRYIDYYTVSSTVDGVETISQRFGSNDIKPAITENNVTNKLYIYVLEGTQTGEVRTESEEKRMIIVPDSTINQTYNPADYVLFASSADGIDGYETTNSSVPSGTYEVKNLLSLGWRDGDGYTLGDNSISANSALYKKFCVTEGIDFNLQLNIGNIFSINTPGLITAPVGTNGQYANIPQGCIAYRKNTTTTEAQTINVIVAVPITETYIGENDTINVADKRYFSLWKAEESGSSFLQIFDPEDTVDRFVLPHSNPYNKDITDLSKDVWDTNKNLNYIKVKADIVNNETGEKGSDGVLDTATYRSYLNGDRVLIAYSFSITDEGVYILGAYGTKTVNNQEQTVPVPMEIVYFSAPGAASEGNDSVPNSQLGSIDFVYSNTTDVLTVKNVQIKPTDLTAEYYPSYSFFYFDTRLSNNELGYILINEGKVYVKRTSTAADSTITWSREMNDDLVTNYGEYIKFNQYVIGEKIVENKDNTP